MIVIILLIILSGSKSSPCWASPLSISVFRRWFYLFVIVLCCILYAFRKQVVALLGQPPARDIYIYIYEYVCIYVIVISFYTCIHLFLSLALSLSLYMYIYIYIHRLYTRNKSVYSTAEMLKWLCSDIDIISFYMI